MSLDSGDVLFEVKLNKDNLIKVGTCNSLEKMKTIPVFSKSGSINDQCKAFMEDVVFTEQRTKDY